MLQMGSYAYVGDNTGVTFVKIFQVLGKRSQREATVGDAVLVVISHTSRHKSFVSNEKKKKKFRRGSVHRAIIINTRGNYKRHNGLYLYFRRNFVVIVDKFLTPYGTKVTMPVPKEVTKKYPAIGAIAEKVY